MRIAALNQRRPGRKESGNTAIEVIASAVLMALMVVSIAGGFSGGFLAVQNTREEIRATQIMVEKLETIRLYTFSQVETPNFLPTTFRAPFDYTTTNSNALYYDGTLTVENANNGTPYDGDMKKITVTLTWSFGTLRPSAAAQVVKTRSMSTWIARTGLHDYIYY
jgi:hypothetical protein